MAPKKRATPEGSPSDREVKPRLAVRAGGAAAAAAAFQWLSPQEAVLQRPDMYVGGLDALAGDGRLLDPEMKRVKRTWSLSPIWLKIFDEVVVNALDQGVRDSELRKIAVSFSQQDGSIVVENDGKGIPILFFCKDGVQTERYIPEVLFTELSAGSNFDDTQERLLGGRNGVGVSCTNIWSSLFEVEVRDKQRVYRQTFRQNLTQRDPPEVVPQVSTAGIVRIRFRPDYERMDLDWASQTQLLEDLLRTRTAEVAICARRGIKVLFNGAVLPCAATNFAAALFGEEGLLVETFGRCEGPHVEVTIGPRRDCEAFMAFVNGVRCDGGSLATHLFEKLHKQVSAIAAKQKANVTIRLQSVKEHLAVLALARIDKPRFTSQGKEALSTPVKSFGFTVEFSDRFQAKLAKLPAVEALIRHEVEHELARDMKKVIPSKKTADVNIDKYDPALDCRKAPGQCTLILTEGDSAKALAVAGLAVVGRDRFGVYPLRGKVLNVRNKPMKISSANKEIAALLKILNVVPGAGPEQLRYGRIAIFTDQDSDGAHIAGLLLNVFHFFFPEILKARPDFVCRIVTPLIKATPKRGGEAALKEFFSVQAFNSWSAAAPAGELASYTLKYYKGLGTSTSKDAKQIFHELARHTIAFVWDPLADARIVAFFDDKQVTERKRILTEDYSPELTVDFAAPELPVSEFLQKDLIHYSMYSTFRGIASAIDGLTPSRRKVLYYFMGVKGNQEVKVAQAAAGTAMKTQYLHGETSLVESIVGMAQEHVGTNNVALLMPLGQFGSRLDPPSTHAAARYIFTKLSNVARAIFPKADDDVLEYRQEEGESIEPKHFCGVVPMILVNGASGIATGFSSSVPCHSLPSVVSACRAHILGEAAPPLEPWHEDFEGPVAATAKGTETRGVCERTGPSSLLITELPVGRWTDVFLTDLKEAGEKAKFPIGSIVNRSTDTKVCIELHFVAPIQDVEDDVIFKALKLIESIPNTFMWLHDADYRLKLCQTYQDIIELHAAERLRMYGLRKAHVLARLARELKLARGRMAFIELVVSGKLQLSGKRRQALEEELVTHGLQPLVSGTADAEASFDYALGMSFSVCTEEAITKLRDTTVSLEQQVAELEAKTVASMWLEELDGLLVVHKDYLRLRRERRGGDHEDEASAPASRAKAKAAPKARRAKAQQGAGSG